MIQTSYIDQKNIKKTVLKSGSSFFWGMNILEKKRRRAIFAVYAFCRTVDDIADSNKSKKEKLLSLKIWRKQIKDVYKNLTFDSLTRELLFSINEFNLKKNDFFEIINGMEMDVRKKIVYPNLKELEKYCDKVAGAVGCLSINIFGISNIREGRKYAIYLGRALQFTNILRDVKEDSVRGRCYLYKELLIEKKLDQVSPTELINRSEIDTICREFLIKTKTYYLMADKKSVSLERNKLLAAEIMKAMYEKLCKKMCRSRWSVKQKVKLNLYEKFVILLFKFMKG